MSKYHDQFGIERELSIAGKSYRYFSLPELEKQGKISLSKLPKSLRILVEQLVRNLGSDAEDASVFKQIAAYDPQHHTDVEMPFFPARVLLQDFTGVPCLVDLAALRSAVARLGKNPQDVNPVIPVDLVIDHSLNTDSSGTAQSFQTNAEIEFARNKERYEFLRWGQSSFRNFRVIPPASGICHQVNLEYIASVVTARDGYAFFDTLVGTDSHTTMINALGVLGWGVGGIEAESAMLGQSISMLVPAVLGVKLTGALKPGVSATDLVLTVTQKLRKHGVVNKIVEYFGPGIAQMSVPDRATLSNMAPEYGATAGYFPIDEQTLDYLRLSGRTDEHIALVEAYAKAQGVFGGQNEHIEFEHVLEIDLGEIEACISGPKRPQDRIPLRESKAVWRSGLGSPVDQKGGYAVPENRKNVRVPAQNAKGERVELAHGHVVIASITSCTNTSSPSLMLSAGLLAKNAVDKGLTSKPWVTTSFAPGSRVVSKYLARAGLQEKLDALGFNVIGYACASCIGNSGTLPDSILEASDKEKLVLAAVLSGNRNFEGRVNPGTRANFLASPALCVAYAIAGTVDFDFENDALGEDASGNPVFLRHIWPSEDAIKDALQSALKPEDFRENYAGIENSNPKWNALPNAGTTVFSWKEESTYIQEAPFFRDGIVDRLRSVENARILAVFGDSITTDHISPAGSIDERSPAGVYLKSLGVAREDFNSYGSRRGNDRVMTRGTFANIRLKNRMVPGVEGGVSIAWDGAKPETLSIFEVAQRYEKSGTPCVVIAGKDYGMGSSRDWAAKGVMLLGVRAIVAESFERIHRSNLVGMGVIPLEFLPGENAGSFGLKGDETISVVVPAELRPKQRIQVKVTRADGSKLEFATVIRVDSAVEAAQMRNGGILQSVLRNFTA